MIVIADISIPSDAFPLGRILDDYPDIEIELERLVPLSEAIIPLFWIDDGEADIEAVLQDDPLTEQVTQLTEADGRVLYEIKWSPEVDGVVQSLIETDARLLGAEGTADMWDFRVQFRTRGDMRAFRQSCEDHDVPLTLRRLYNPALPDEGGRLSGPQYEALMDAYNAGYFEVPRATTMDTLAADLGISDSAVSQRIRRGTAALIAETLLSDLGNG